MCVRLRRIVCVLRQPRAGASLTCVQCQYCLCAMPILPFHSTLKAHGCLWHECGEVVHMAGSSSQRANTSQPYAPYQSGTPMPTSN